MATKSITDLVELFGSHMSPLRLLLTESSISSWADLAPEYVLASAVPDASKQLRPYNEKEVQRLARRVILGRDAGLFESLIPLWRTFGETEDSCTSVRTAIEQSVSNWGKAVYDWNSSNFQFSLAHYEFIESMATASQGNGVFAKAINDSRIRCEERHPGFPIVRQDDLKIASSYWVHIDDSIENFQSERVTSLWEHVNQLLVHAFDLPKNSIQIVPSLPVWFHELDAVLPINSLESAALSCVMHQFAKMAGVALPFGVGFTGSIVNKRLKAVANVIEKVRAAKNAGIFLFFACADQNIAIPDQIDGIRLVLLQEGLELNEAVQIVNRVCAESGITEYRWRLARQIPKYSHGARTNTTHSPDLPDALDKDRCPVGFIGRESTLMKLRTAFDKLCTTRRFVIVHAPARSGKTTLLSRFAEERSIYPSWYSFRRGHANYRTLEQLQQSIEAQIKARFIVGRSTESTSGSWDCIHPECRVDLIVDGLDEAESSEQSKIVEWLQRITLNGVTVIASQPIRELSTIETEKIELRNESPSGQNDARKLIGEFAKIFATIKTLKPISSQLRQDDWVEGLVEKSGANLWVLNEFLASLAREETGWPGTPLELPLSNDIQEYCDILVNIVLKGYDERDRNYVERFLATVSFLDDQRWNVRDILKIANIDSDQPWGVWGYHGALAKNSRRLLDFNGQSVRFWSPLTREAVRRVYSGYSQEFASTWICLIQSQNEPRRGALLDNLISSITPLIEEIGHSELNSGLTSDAQLLTDRLLFESPWIYLRFRMVVNDYGSVALLITELKSLSEHLRSDSAKSVSLLIGWLKTWGKAIADSRALVDDWWNSKVKLERPFPTPNLTPAADSQLRLLTPVIGPNVSDQQYELNGSAKQKDKSDKKSHAFRWRSLWMNEDGDAQESWFPIWLGQRQDNEIVIQVFLKQFRILPFPLANRAPSAPKLKVDGLVIAKDGTEIGWIRKESKIVFGDSAGCIHEILLDQLLGLSGKCVEKIEIVREVVPTMELEICFKENEAEKLSLARFSRIDDNFTLLHFYSQVAREIGDSSGDAIIVQDDFSSPRVLFLPRRNDEHTFMLSDVAPDSHKSDRIRLLVNDCYLRAVRPIYSSGKMFRDRFRANDFCYIYLPYQSIDAIGIAVNLSTEFEVISRRPAKGLARVADVIYIESTKEWRFKLLDFRIPNRSNLEESKWCSKETILTRSDEVCCWDWVDDYFAILFSSGRLEIRSLNAPDTVLKVGYCLIEEFDLPEIRFVRHEKGLFIVALASTIGWFLVS